MKNAVFLLTLCTTLLVGCITPQTAGKAVALVESRDFAKHLALEHVRGDEIATQIILANMAAIDVILTEAKKIDSGKALYEFAKTKQWMVLDSAHYYLSITEAIADHNEIENKESTPELLLYDKYVRETYQEILDAIKEQDRLRTVGEFVFLLARIKAASIGRELIEHS